MPAVSRPDREDLPMPSEPSASLPTEVSPSPKRSPSRAIWLGFVLLAAAVAVAVWGPNGSRVPSLPLNSTLLAADPQTDEPSEKPAKKGAAKTTKKDADKKDDDVAGELENPFPKRFKMEGTELDGGVEWLNTSGEISLKDLRGKVVLVDFWTYCCINCMHILPDLKYLEHKYPKELVVIGVHSAKFDNEKETENIRRAALRYEIEHPIVNDAEMKIWRSFGVRAWPTLVLLDPEGYYCGYISGEGNREPLDAIIAKVIAYHKAKGTLDETPVKFDLERQRVKPGALRFPGKVLADEASNRLFITDSNHNRLVVTSLDGKLQDVIGSGTPGAADGDYKSASFFRPQGTALVGDKLYVADTENHLLRVVDLKAKKVTTLAGTGEQAHFRANGGPLRKTALNSPWALSHVDGTLYIAMAGPHQLWSHELDSDTISVFAGSGREDILNGPHSESAFAQPSGISSDGKFLYVADSEGSSIRKVPIASKGEVTTVAGTSDLPSGQSLFAFGDIDGVGKEARFQHPLDVLYHDGSLFVADSYNHKIKKIDAKKRDVKTFLGNGKAGTELSPAQLSEPAGLSIAKGKLFVADTNNHRICVVDLKSGEMSELKINGLQPPPPPKDEDPATDAKGTIDLTPQSIAAGDSLKLDISFRFPKGYKLNQLAKVTYKLEAAGEQKLIAADHLKGRQTAEVKDDVATASIPLAAKEGEAKLALSVSFSYCRDGVGGLCKLKTSKWNIPVKVSADGKSSTIKLEAVAE
jgi:thiol-disulfide isomerase/thioredoxin/outer membrane protein assembly factor BamB